MMRLWSVLFLYGSCMVIGGFLFLFWGMRAFRRINEVRPPWWKDRHAIITLGFSLVTFGTTLEYVGRTYGNLQFGLSSILQRGEGMVILGGLWIVLIGFVFLVGLADMETDPPKWTWLGWLGIFTIVWGVVSVLIMPYVPLG